MSAPQTRRDDLVETLHGVEVADPYRWLEDPDAPEVVDWVERQRAHTAEVFTQLGDLDWFHQTLRRIVVRPHRSAPWRDNGWYLQTRNDGSTQQDLLHGARSLQALLEGGDLLLDPNSWSENGTSSLAGVTVSPDGTKLAHAISAAGSDWTTYRVLDLTTGRLLDDEVVTKFSAPTWLPDSTSLLYLEWSSAGESVGTDATALSGPVLWQYALGGERTQLFSFPDDPSVMFGARVVQAREGGSNADWLVLEGSRGTERTNRVWVAPLQTTGGRTTVGAWVTVFGDDDHQRDLVTIVGDRLIHLTHQDAVRGRLVAVDLTRPEQPVEVVVDEQEGTLEDAWATASGILTCHLVDVAPVLTRWSSTGERLGEVDLKVGAVTAVSAESSQDEVFVATSSVAEPGEAWRLDASTGQVEPLPDPDALDPLPVVQLRRHATSTDGTRVPYWVLSRADLPLEGPRPTLVYGYGGFTIPVLADYRPGWRGWLEAGGVLAICNLRGGGEFGQEWYDQGRGAHKQHVFDDFIACAEDMVAGGITTPDQLACYGRSNGGLLVGAAITQRPDLYGAALPQVGVLDLYRFHTFTIGAAWISDYGDPDLAEDFAVVQAYSPLHNVRPGTHYPPTLVITGDHDDRVVPAHSHKFTATLQAAQGGDAPIATRIEPATGHGPGKPAHVIAEEWADLLAWAAHFTGLRPH
ncbi:prolyl oligopeptidase family serine peptidase [Aestuariimicrobium ganziense]|uniref:prolyl oligopeptidase family serine peptidase n=1 Tax=Aestuariimicrobium ganziense TaxID=2773677 RepID=UPI00194352C1|nr:prolyl oligopeptidase family serine peptidase [Aestuariimicrobium ganziense]